MSRCFANASVKNNDLKIASPGGGYSWESNEDLGRVDSLEITTREQISYGEITTPKCVMVENVNVSGGANVLVGIEANDEQELEPGESCLIRLRNSDRTPIYAIDTVADSFGHLNGAWFNIVGRNSSWSIWFQLSVSGASAPGALLPNAIRVIYDGSATKETIATLLYNALAADTTFLQDFSVVQTDSDTITVTDRHVGQPASMADGTTPTNFTLGVTQASSDGRKVYVTSASGTSTVVITVIPN